MTLNNEYVVAASLLDLDVIGVADLARTAARVPFLPADGKAALIVEIDATGRPGRVG
jgi:aminodeoxyfutalosine deaminase